MKVKSYFAGTVEAAMRLASQELGDDAVLLNSRKAPLEARHLGEYEVVFGQTDEAARPAAAASASAQALSSAFLEAASQSGRGAAKPSPAAAEAGGGSDISEMRRQLDRVFQVVARSQSLLSGKNLQHPIVAELNAVLLGQEVHPELAHAISAKLDREAGDDAVSAVNRVISEIRQEAGSAGAGKSVEGVAKRIVKAARHEIESAIQVAAGVGSSPGTSPKITMLVGPPGSGKTSALVKLAVAHGISTRRSTHLVSLDSDRVAGCEQLRSYAAILGAGFLAVDSYNGLARAVQETRHKDLILIDTPGWSGTDLDPSNPLARQLKEFPQIDVQLVLSASMKPADLSRVVDRFDVLRPARLLFTHLDETGTFGPIWSEAVRKKLPLSFFSSGPRIPEDLEPATRSAVANLLLGAKVSRSKAATR